MKEQSEIVKGIALALTLTYCYGISAGSGACLNPALGLTWTTYYVGLINGLEIRSTKPASYFA
jgi:hypothetical protein